MKNPVILIESVKRRDHAMRYLMGKGLEFFDASGSRAVVWSETTKHTKTSLERIIKEVGPLDHVKLSVIEDPGLGIMLPGDFE